MSETGQAARARITTPRRLGGLATVLAAFAIAGGCATGATFSERADARHEWLGQTFASVVDATDKAFGEPRVEDREQIVRAKIGVEASYLQGDGTSWSIPSNFRIPLPALERRANIFVAVVTDSASSDTTNMNSLSNDKNSSLSASYIKRLTDTIDVSATFDVYGGWDIGPKVKLRYERSWDPWMLYTEQQAFWRTEDGWGGSTSINIDYKFADKSSYVRFANSADYYEQLHNADLSSALIYRRNFFGNTAISVEAGVEYNPYPGDPALSNAADPGPDEDNVYGKVRVIGKIWKPWIEWQVLPGYYYRWEQDKPGAWGIDFRLSLIYEALLGGKK
jgi:hypothetical protein